MSAPFSNPLFPLDADIAGIEPVLRGSPESNRSATERLRVLLHAQPLFALAAADTKRDESLRHYDTLALAIRLFDVIVDNSGFEIEITRGFLVRSLAPLLEEVDRAEGVDPKSECHEIIVDRVLGALRNDANQRRPFVLDYQDFNDQGRAVRRQLEFRLLVERFNAAATPVLDLSPEAINLYLRACDMDLEDAQVANEAVVASQLARGKFNEARQTAQNARWQSVRYCDRVSQTIQQSRRDVERLDWRHTIPELLTTAMAHVQSRLAAEENILEVAHRRLASMDVEEPQSRPLRSVVELIQDCRLRHLELHHQLMQARNSFLDQQARQCFSGLSRTTRVELTTDVLAAVLGMPRKHASQVLDRAVPALVGVCVPRLLSVSRLWGWQLRARRDDPQTAVDVLPPDLTDDGAEALAFDGPTRDAANLAFSGITDGVCLSHLLSDAANQFHTPKLRHLLALKTLETFGADASETGMLRVRKTHLALNAPGFVGDEFELWREGHGHG